jgi:potassium/chloride transporter 9
VCAISTNGAIEGGGIYYMISRALGPEFGGSIGTLFFFANAIGSGFNAVGLVEAFLDNYGKSELNPSGIPQTRWFKFLYGSMLNVISLVIVLLGANLFSYAVSFIYLILCGVFITVVLSIFITNPKDVLLPGLSNSNVTGRFTGLSSQTFSDNLFSNYTVDYTTGQSTNFAFIFGVLFSSLTGIMAGANMSGELKKPSRSIPAGTMGAVVFVFIIYVTENLLLAASCDHNLLVYNNKVLQEISFWGPLVPIGIIASTFSSELSCIIGSSRILKALADDDLFGSALNFVKFGKTKAGNPIVAVIISFVIAQVT